MKWQVGGRNRTVMTLSRARERRHVNKELKKGDYNKRGLELRLSGLMDWAPDCHDHC